MRKFLLLLCVLFPSLGIANPIIFMPKNDLYKQDDVEAYEAKLKANDAMEAAASAQLMETLSDLGSNKHCPKPRPQPHPTPVPQPTPPPNPNPNPNPTPVPQPMMTQALFNTITDQVVSAHSAYVASLGGKLTGEKDWLNPEVNAYANQSGSSWIIHMYGGLARRKEVTPDGFALVACHEVGHHLGGFPTYPSPDTWAAVEGQADYWGARSCAKRIWRNAYKVNARRAQEIRQAHVLPMGVAENCDKVYSNVGKNDVNLCLRISAAGQSLANLLAALEGSRAPNYDTPDPSSVDSTDPNHPAAQCRLDTYMTAFLCSRFADPSVLTKSEQDDVPVSCTEFEGFKAGFQARPHCWFAPEL